MEYKGYMIVPLRTFPMFEIKAKGQGKRPEPLAGTYTTRGDAERSVDRYLDSLLKGKATTNGKTKSRSTG